MPLRKMAWVAGRGRARGDLALVLVHVRRLRLELDAEVNFDKKTFFILSKSVLILIDTR